MRKIEGLGPRQSCSCRGQAGGWERPERGRQADRRVGLGPSAALGEGGGSAQGYHPNSKPSPSSSLLMVPFPHLNLPHPEPSPLPTTSSPSIPALCPPHPNPRPKAAPQLDLLSPHPPEPR